MLACSAAGDKAVVDEIVRLVNAAYAVGEAGLWIEGAERTGSREIAERIGGGGMLVAARDGRILGCACVTPLDASTAELGFVCATPDQWGTGLGRELVHRAEEMMRASGATTMQLNLLVPQGWVHPEKNRLRAWYGRLGYRVVRTAAFEEIVPHAVSLLATPCDILVFRKSLASGS